MKNKTLIIIGAGMSVNLGMPTTQDINRAIDLLLDVDNKKAPTTIDMRLTKIADEIHRLKFTKEARKDFITTLSILLDGDGAKDIKTSYDTKRKALDDYKKLFKRHISGVKIPSLEHHLEYLHQTYDLLSLKSIIYSLKQTAGSDSEVDIVDILTTIQHAIAGNVSIPTKEIFPDEAKATKNIYYCDRKRLVGALNIYKLLVYKLFKHSLRNIKTSDIGKYEKFYHEIAEQFSGVGKLINPKTAVQRQEYLSSIAYITYNWDPIAPFLTMKVNQKINRSLSSSSKKGVCRKIYIDFGVPFAGIKLSGDHVGMAVYSFSEDAAFHINEFTRNSYAAGSKGDKKSKLLVKLMKLFVPHGLFNVRVCPRCQNGFLIIPENIGKIDFKQIANLFTPDPIPSQDDLKFISGGTYNHVLSNYKKGLPDELTCPSCEHPVYFDNSFMEIQSILKQDKPASINKIHFDYGDFFSQADHIISIGYSFPKDDIVNSVFLKTMKIRMDEKGTDCKLTYIGSPTTKYGTEPWYKLKDVRKLAVKLADDKTLQTIEMILKLFKEDNVRLSFKGFPGIADSVKMKDILNWEK
ncbi:MAG: hypothetical protein HZA11_08445 [Nitrospirae bacterium]|nr:hypothetical protein [Nitrospirota bacterium]